MGNLNFIKILKIVGTIVIIYFIVNLLFTVLNIALGLAIKLLVVGVLIVGILYGVKMLKGK